MTDQQLHDELDRLVRQSEPPFTLTGSDVRARSLRSRARRRAAASGAGALAAAVVVGALAGGLLSTHVGPEVADGVAPFSPDDLAAAIGRAPDVTGPGSGRWTSDAVRAYDTQDNVIHGPDRDKASRWAGTFSAGEGHVLEVRLGHELRSMSALEGDCRGEIDAGMSLACDVRQRADGAVVQVVVRRVWHVGGAWIVKPGGNEIDGTGWYQHLARVGTHDGSVTVMEVARATSLTAAESAWLESPTDLELIASDADLRFPTPPLGEDGCGWVVPDEQGLYSCGGGPA